MKIARYLPILDWGSRYNSTTLTNDGVAAIIVTIMLIPQSLAYAMLAGLPPEIGLYASILPLIAYAIFGTSRTLAVGPVAVVSLMTLTAASAIAPPGSADFIAAALVLALLSGLFLLLMGIFKLGFLANLLSHPVVSGFITASGIIIATSQLKSIFGIKASGAAMPELVSSIAATIGTTNIPTLIIGVSATAFLFWVRKGLKPLLMRIGLPARPAELIAKAGPIAAVAVSTIATIALGLEAKGVSVVGDIPQSLPPFSVPLIDLELWTTLAIPALLLSIIGFVESVSVGQTLAAKRRQRIDPDQELIGLGAANISAAFSGGYPVTGGFARSVVNFDAGAETPAAGAFTAIGIALAALFLTPLLASLPIATLAATIIVAVLSLVDLKTPLTIWRYSKADFAAMAATIGVTLLAGVEPGVIAGVGLSLALFLWRSSRPHAAIVGRVPESEHFRNVDRHKVFTDPRILTIRIDESLTYLNARWLEEFILEQVAEQKTVRHVILMCSAVNAIDASALESIEAINHRLDDGGISLHLSEVKGPVMDRLKRSHFLDQLSGKVYLSQNAAYSALIAIADNEDKADSPVDIWNARGLI
ncbi:sulfate permease [Parasphingorhabdus flavimaris]|jgi:sulfate permease, SulP family|uniref:Sulfate permease n=1 Tax=Parasphingorhabdus flavimaris TaxID=266812 RepID=A0ABX2N520_9SPHN|nr:sulfate permease [Parasphingorhabdus flavimaris]NVD28774.1 sulfate permease [Parasphingorhabdus flavimaris]|tara:strand:- start:25126 stop:26895 length:1770 start_codon:yes stop_codon:yes gene_type:complete